VSTSIGAIGAIVPGLPTTIFLIIASYCFARSCPWLEERLLRRRLFAPYMAWIDGQRQLPRRAKAGALAAMWIAVCTSLSLLWFAGQLGPWILATIVIAAIAGTAAIATDATSRLRTGPVTAEGTNDAGALGPRR
jgi:uncharacterized membrane protein YbaN (DUF454 family)